MIVEDFADIGRRLRTMKPDPVDSSGQPDVACPLPSDRNSIYRDCRRQCGQPVHGVTRACDGSCHVVQ
jgi:hypothetical protein